MIKKILCPLLLVSLSGTLAHAHLCDNVFRQKDKLIVKPESYNIVVKDRTTFKIFLQNNMDRAITEIKLLADSPAFDFIIKPSIMSIPKDQKVFFEVTMIPKPNTRTGNYPVNFRFVDSGRQAGYVREFASLNLNTASGQGQGVADNTAKKEPPDETANLIQVKPINSLPKLDGLLNDVCWKKTAVLSNFSSTAGGAAKFQSVVLAAFDKEYLYLGVYCFDDNAAGLTGSDKVEFLLSTDPSGYPSYSINLHPAGSLYIKKAINGKNIISLDAAGTKYLISKENNAWSAEIGIPFSDLGIQPPAAREKWYLRVVRTKTTGSGEKSYWSADATGYNSERNFGEIIINPQ